MMIAKIGRIILASAFMAAPAAALDLEGLPQVKDIVRNARSAADEAPVPAATTDARSVKDWTIMVFMNGKNNLSKYVIEDMNEMEKYGAPENVNIVTEAGRTAYTQPSYPSYPGGYDDYPGVVPHPGWPNPYWGGGLPPMLSREEASAKDASTDWTGVRRYLVQKDGDNATLSSRMLQDLGSVDMGDWNQLAEYGKWVKQNYPARHYMLIVWNHGSGWEMRGPRATVRGISYDDQTGHGINPVDLARALRAMGGVDIYASDACLMQMVEVVYEMRDAATIVVGSEETEPGAGWGYDQFLSRVESNKGDLTAEVMAAAAVQGYKATYYSSSQATTQSAVRTSGMTELRRQLDQWVELAMNEDKASVVAARDAALSFEGAASRDLTDFLQLVHGKTRSKALKTKTVQVLNQFYDRVLLDNGTTGDKFKKAYGMGVYLPGWSFDDSYGKLAWSVDGKWDDFMRWLTAK
ncbi:MAG: clostripain-related cysteine peptidase [Elusimicrobia bacterium]|nr:clostripain-related cysteine peptidase [Elusimicrobiota bacterium]